MLKILTVLDFAKMKKTRGQRGSLKVGKRGEGNKLRPYSSV